MTAKKWGVVHMGVDIEVLGGRSIVATIRTVYPFVFRDSDNMTELFDRE